jgi:hypothetical protein
MRSIPCRLQSTGDYLDAITRRYTFSSSPGTGIIGYDGLPLFDTR